MSVQWKYICLMLLKFFEQLLAMDPKENHQPTAAAALNLVESLKKEAETKK